MSEAQRQQLASLMRGCVDEMNGILESPEDVALVLLAQGIIELQTQGWDESRIQETLAKSLDTAMHPTTPKALLA